MSQNVQEWSAVILGEVNPADIDYQFATIDSLETAPRIYVRFASAESEWTGQFQGVTRLPEAAHGVFSHPDTTRALVVASGQGYLLKPAAPHDWAPVDELPLVGVAEIPSIGAVVVADLIHLVAYGRQGRLWETRRVSYDGIRITDADATAIHGLAWSAPEDREVPFVVNPATGAVTGGAAPQRD